jgi:hypothetical protein
LRQLRSRFGELLFEQTHLSRGIGQASPEQRGLLFEELQLGAKMRDLFLRLSP